MNPEPWNWPGFETLFCSKPNPEKWCDDVTKSSHLYQDLKIVTFFGCTADPTWGDIFEWCFKAQNSKFESLFSLKRGKREFDLTCKRGSVGQSEGLSIPRSSVRFRLNPDTSNSHEFELHRPSIKGTKILLKVIKAIIIIVRALNFDLSKMTPQFGLTVLKKSFSKPGSVK